MADRRFDAAVPLAVEVLEGAHEGAVARGLAQTDVHGPRPVLRLIPTLATQGLVEMSLIHAGARLSVRPVIRCTVLVQPNLEIRSLEHKKISNYLIEPGPM